MVKRVVVVVMIGVVLLCLAATNYHRLKVIRFRPTSELERFEAQVGLDCKAVHEVVGRRLNRAYRGMEARRQRWEAYMLEDDGWAAEAVARRNSRSPEELEQFALDPELERYYELSPKERQFDWSLVHSGPQWDSEYEYRGKPAPFSASFIVHLRCDGPDATTVQIYEQEAYVCVGEWFGLQVNFGHLFSSYSFGFHPDCRRVAPTRVGRSGGPAQAGPGAVLKRDPFTRRQQRGEELVRTPTSTGPTSCRLMHAPEGSPHAHRIPAVSRRAM